MTNWKIKKREGGFTIIETMIAVSIFIVITTVGMGALLNAHLLYQKSHDMRSIIDNLNFVMEDMSRNLRTGYDYHCYNVGEEVPTTFSVTDVAPQNCTNGWALSFENAYGNPDEDHLNDQWVYYIDNNHKIFRATDPATYEAPVQLTLDEVDINPAKSFFVVSGAESGEAEDEQPLVTIRLVGTITYHDVVTPFSMQTSMSQRLLDI